MPDPRYLPGASTPTPDASPEPAMRWPSWMDTQFALEAVTTKFRPFTSGPSGGDMQVPGNSLRWAIGFFIPSSALNVPVIRPDGMPAGYGWSFPQNVINLWLKLFDYGPMVTQPWIITTSSQVTIVVAEVVLN